MQAKNNQLFTNLFQYIISDENIKRACQKIKGANSFIIADELIKLIRHKIIYYQPIIIKKQLIYNNINNNYILTEISTEYNKIIQQCFKQVLEPICEAHFSPHSYGFRPGRSVENAIAEIYQKINVNDLYYVIEINIKNFYENINHSKLIRQLWTLGIQDTRVIYRIKVMLKSNIAIKDNIYALNKGIFQSGILTSLLANVVLNELDQWIENQWNLFSTRHQYSDHGNKIRALKKTNLKEMYIIRYAEQIRIFCRTLDQAQRSKIAIINWIHERLKLAIDTDQINIINLNNKYSTFLGFKYTVLHKGIKKVVKAEVNDDNIKYIFLKLKQQLYRIQHSSKSNIYKEITKYNQLVEDIHQYYEIATCVNISFHRINNIINNIINNRLPVIKQGKCNNKRYANSKQIRYLMQLPIYPIGYVQFRKPLLKKFNSN